MNTCSNCVFFTPSEDEVLEGTDLKEAIVSHTSDLNPGYCSHWKATTMGTDACQDHESE